METVVSHARQLIHQIRRKRHPLRSCLNPLPNKRWVIVRCVQSVREQRGVACDTGRACAFVVLKPWREAIVRRAW